jgi:hypothetical protein
MEHVDRASAKEPLDPGVRARAEALKAQAVIGSGRIENAAGHAGVALELAERAGLPELACEALEVIGRCARTSDLVAAEAAFRVLSRSPAGTASSSGGSGPSTSSAPSTR